MLLLPRMDNARLIVVASHEIIEQELVRSIVPWSRALLLLVVVHYAIYFID